MTGRLERRLGVGDAVIIGVGSMIGAGVFAAWAPAADAAGSGLLLGLVLAGAVAWANATSSAQLAALHPESGGTYIYGRHRLGHGWGHLAGWGFIVGKTASCSAMALTVGAYLTPGNQRVGAVAAVVGIAGVNLGGLTRTVAVTRILLTVSGTTLVVIAARAWGDENTDVGRIEFDDLDALGVLRSAGLLFFAFAGYARVATLGEEVRQPEVTIPKAIPRALGFVLVVYAIVGVTALAAVGPEALAATDAPLRVVAGTDSRALDLIVRIGAGIAALGVLLNLIPGISRTVLALARNGELPVALSTVDSTRSLPLRAEAVVVATVLFLVAVLRLDEAIAFSGVAVLTYYAITNASALALAPNERIWPRSLAIFGLVGCLVLIVSLPFRVVATGLIILAVGVVVRLAIKRPKP